MNPSLKQVLSSCSYQNKRRVEDDAKQALSAYSQLQPKKVSDAGTGKMILSLTGTIPVTIQGSTYNIPVSVNIPNGYPYTKPEARVNPTSDMSIAPGHPNVDPYGQITLNYITGWHPGSNIVGAINAMILAFSLKSPLYAKPRQPPMQQQQQQQQTPPMQPMGPYNSPYGGAYGGAYAYQQQPPQLQQTAGGYGNYAYQQQPQQTTMYVQTPPPIPPKPGMREREIIGEKMREKAATVFAETARAENELRALDDANGNNNNNNNSNGVERLRIMEEEISGAKREVEEKEKWIAENRNDDVMDEAAVDRATDAEDALVRQKMRLAATDAAIADVIYTLDKALKDGTIALDEYLKMVRKYSSEQYYAKALAEKVDEAINR